MRGEKYIFNEENINDITCGDPPAEEMMCISTLINICAQGTADELD